MTLTTGESAAQKAGYIMPEDSDYVSGGAEAIRTNAVQAYSQRWFRGVADTTMHYTTMHPGWWLIGNGSVATAVGTPVVRRGWLEITAHPDSVRTARFKTDHVSSATGLEIWEITSDSHGDFDTSSWEQMFPHPSLDRGGAPEGWDYRTAEAGQWKIANSSVADAAGLPAERTGWVEIRDGWRDRRIVEFHTDDLNDGASLEYWTISTDPTGDWSRPWHRIYPAEETSQGATGNAADAFRHRLLAEEQRNSVGGPVYTAGAVPVALVWDDWPAMTRDRIIPMLRARGLTATYAIGVEALGSRASTLGGEGITWDEIAQWVSDGTVEIAHHGKTHLDRTTRSGIYEEVVTGLAELRAALPDADIQCWVQPEAEYDEGFDNGASIEAWANTYAGQTILGHHAFVTGMRKLNTNSTALRDGQPIQGLKRAWIDHGTSGARALIEYLQETDNAHGVILGSHANRLDIDGGTTTEDMTDFLDWLAAEQTAGRIAVLKLSEWAYADARIKTS